MGFSSIFFGTHTKKVYHRETAIMKEMKVGNKSVPLQPPQRRHGPFSSQQPTRSFKFYMLIALVLVFLPFFENDMPICRSGSEVIILILYMRPLEFHYYVRSIKMDRIVFADVGLFVCLFVCLVISSTYRTRGFQEKMTAISKNEVMSRFWICKEVSFSEDNYIQELIRIWERTI